MVHPPKGGQAMSKRRWFQFHLSTAVVLMFVAGGLMWANTRVDDSTVVSTWSDPATGSTGLSVWVRRYAGWPCALQTETFGNNYPQSELDQMGIRNQQELSDL